MYKILQTTFRFRNSDGYYFDATRTEDASDELEWHYGVTEFTENKHSVQAMHQAEKMRTTNSHGLMHSSTMFYSF